MLKPEMEIVRLKRPKLVEESVVDNFMKRLGYDRLDKIGNEPVLKVSITPVIK